jgi:diphthine-ammonia ligase
MSLEKTAAVLYSGGKDSTFTCGRLLSEGFKIACLITMKSLNRDSYMLHTSNIEMVKLGAAAMNLPIVYGNTQGEKESELLDISNTIRAAMKRFDFDFLATGALSSNYQKKRIETIANTLQLTPISPLWERDQVEYLRSVVQERYEFILTSVSCEGLDDTYLGRTVTPELAERIISQSKRYKFNPAFEGGEAETLVLDCPLFPNKKIKILESRVLWDGYTGSLAIGKAILDSKQLDGN